jgi:hypothetical protein
MQQIADWFHKLDLGQYVQRFAENDGLSNRRFIAQWFGTQVSA